MSTLDIASAGRIVVHPLKEVKEGLTELRDSLKDTGVPQQVLQNINRVRQPLLTTKASK